MTKKIALSLGLAAFLLGTVAPALAGEKQNKCQDAQKQCLKDVNKCNPKKEKCKNNNDCAKEYAACMK